MCKYMDMEPKSYTVCFDAAEGHHTPAKDVIVEYQESEKVWTALNEELGLVVEADTYDEVVQISWELAPHLADMNGDMGNGEKFAASLHTRTCCGSAHCRLDAVQTLQRNYKGTSA